MVVGEAGPPWGAVQYHVDLLVEFLCETGHVTVLNQHTAGQTVRGTVTRQLRVMCLIVQVCFVGRLVL